VEEVSVGEAGRLVVKNLIRATRFGLKFVLWSQPRTMERWSVDVACAY
jgi:hypothetical protein